MNSAALPELSVIIPALNEAETLPLLLGDLARQQSVLLEILIGDGGSGDATRSIARSSGAGVIPAQRGRGIQMNAAAAQARGAYLLFLHADSRLDDPLLLRNALQALKQACQQQPKTAGHFPLRFIRANPGKNRLAFRYIEAKTRLNRAGTTNGDQGLLLAAAFFRELGGFDESLPFLEDQRIAARIRELGRWITLPGELWTSARRFETEGFHRRYLLMGMIMGMHRIGMHSFFTQAPEVYRVQHKTGRLLLSPFFRLLWAMALNDWGWQGTARVFYHLGRYIRENAWQLFCFADVCLQPFLGWARSPVLKVYDRCLAPCLRFRLVDALLGLWCFCWYMGVLTVWFNLIEPRAPGREEGGR